MRLLLYARAVEGSETRPLRRDAERNRLKILQAAREVFAEDGLAATLDDVARRAGVGVGTVYRRFPDKDALIDAVLQDGIGQMVGFAEAGLAIEDPWEGLTHFMREALALQAGHRGLKELMYSGSRGQERTTAARERISPLATRLLQRAQEAGQVRADLSPTDLPILQFMVGTAIDYTRDIDPELWRRLHVIVLDGLRPQRDAPTALPVPALGFPELARAMSGWRPPPR